MNPGQLTEKMLNEAFINKYQKALLKSALDGTAENLRTAFKWLNEKQDYQMMGARGTELVYRQLKEARLVFGHQEWIQKQLEKQSLSSHGMLREAALNPHTPRHMGTYANNLLIQVRAALQIMKDLKSREHSEHLNGNILVPLAKWNEIRREKPHSHPIVSDAVAATIEERLDANAMSFDSAALTLMQMKQFEQWLYRAPEITSRLEQQLSATCSMYEQWLSWLKEEKVIENRRHEKFMAAGQFKHFLAM